MKKYVKPEIKYENFSLAQSIASGCDPTLGWFVRGQVDVPGCYVESVVGGGLMSVFNNSNTNCKDYKETEAMCEFAFDGTATIMTGSY